MEPDGYVWFVPRNLRRAIPWPILSVAAWVIAVYVAVSHDGPWWTVALVGVFAAFQLVVLGLWAFAVWHNRRLDRRASSE